MGYLKKIAIFAVLLATAFLAYQVYIQWRDDRTRLEQDAQVIADMLKQTKQKR
jgi:uncharacterized membrane protein YebE (DUF533 family)